ncbi:type-2 ice-structuring protein-like isoform X3 [Phyllopteryx taeniolatus]|uniref:type-2 ice-structuring protein-like isoform X3 n=1 Tax=Phyllopteryx taeniolatus TaxID=161469 RepID=UPI002AD36DD2|nr:type-2 ice-structuring protein-like isoform X3 [Phyllopteryx taeniolatus]
MRPVGVREERRMQETGEVISSTISDTRCHMLKPPLSPKPSGGTVDAGRGQKGPYSQAHCQLFGGNLASVHSDDENAFIRTLTQGTTWLGGSNCQTTGAWLWMDGTQMLFRFWCPLKPDNDLTQCCLQTNTGVNKCWDDVPCSAALPFVCARPL